MISSVCFYVGLGMEWVKEPPSQLQVGEMCTIAYKATVDPDFYKSLLAWENSNLKYVVVVVLIAFC